MEDTSNTGADAGGASPAAEDDIAVPTTPLVFLCMKCKNIVGDSLAMVHSDQQHQQITLSAVSNIKWSSSVSTAKSGHDVGNTYFTFSCSQCEAHFGKYYLTTSQDLDFARERFTFDISSLSSYVLGQAQHGSISMPSEEDAEPQRTEGGGGGTGNATLEIDVLQVQEAVVGLLERVGRLEEVVQEHVIERRGKKRKIAD